MYNNTSSKDLPKRAKKTALRLDGVQSSLGIGKLRMTGSSVILYAVKNLAEANTAKF